MERQTNDSMCGPLNNTRLEYFPIKHYILSVSYGSKDVNLTFLSAMLERVSNSSLEQFIPLSHARRSHACKTSWRWEGNMILHSSTGSNLRSIMHLASLGLRWNWVQRLLRWAYGVRDRFFLKEEKYFLEEHEPIRKK